MDDPTRSRPPTDEETADMAGEVDRRTRDLARLSGQLGLAALTALLKAASRDAASAERDLRSKTTSRSG